MLAKKNKAEKLENCFRAEHLFLENLPIPAPAVTYGFLITVSPHFIQHGCQNRPWDNCSGHSTVEQVFLT